MKFLSIRWGSHPPNWDKFVELGLIPPFTGAPINPPTVYFALLVWEPQNGVSALPLSSGAWPSPIEIFETTVNGQPVVGELVNFSTGTVKVPADGARVAFNLAPPLGEHVVRVIFADSLLDFSGAELSQMDLDQVTELVVSNSLTHANGNLHYEAADFGFTLKRD